MRFKVGDKVRVKKKLISGEDYGNLPFVNSMKERRGKVVTIYRKDLRTTAYEIAEDGGDAYWTEEMFEPIEDPLVKKVEERDNKQSDPIKPKHYRKGEIDLYESWYRTYPFNEFRAIMSAIAERYMKRDKSDRIEDLDKAMETLKRLKEYEEMEK